MTTPTLGLCIEITCHEKPVEMRKSCIEMCYKHATMMVLGLSIYKQWFPNIRASTLQHDELQHFLFVSIQSDIAALVRSTDDIVEILDDLISLFLFLEVDGRSISYALGQDTALDRILRGVAIDCRFFLLTESEESAGTPRKTHHRGHTDQLDQSLPFVSQIHNRGTIPDSP